MPRGAVLLMLCSYMSKSSSENQEIHSAVCATLGNG